MEKKKHDHVSGLKGERSYPDLRQRSIATGRSNSLAERDTQLERIQKRITSCELDTNRKALKRFGKPRIPLIHLYCLRLNALPPLSLWDFPSESAMVWIIWSFIADLLYDKGNKG
jgi:hypothetical protein